MATHFDRPVVPHIATSVQALALKDLNAELLNNNSATLTLERWCNNHGLAASSARVVAKRTHRAGKPLPIEQRRLLRARITDVVNYRHVRLCCGHRVLSQADNWYLPEQLTLEMNRQLEKTNTSFGRVVRALDFRRRTLSVKFLWSPTSVGTAMDQRGCVEARHSPIPFRLLEHRAVLTLPDGTPFSVLTETYTSAVLAFLEPARHAA